MKEKIFKIYVTVCVIGVVIVLIWFMSISKSPIDKYEQAINAYKVENYSGKVINKYIDKNEHNFHKIILNEHNKERIILLDFDIGGLFNFIQVGDSIDKKAGTMEVHIIRKNLDTLYSLKFVTPPDKGNDLN